MSLSRRLLLLLPVTVLVIVGASAWALADETRSRGKHATVELLSEHTAVAPGETTTLGIRLKPDEGWHTYWRNPGDAGLPTAVRWRLPPGVEARGFRWPTPARMVEGPIVTYGYEGEVVFPTTLTVSKGFAAPEIRVVAQVSWLVCKDECVPGSARLELVLPVGPGADTAGAPAIAEARRRLPRTTTTDALSVAMRDKALVLTLSAEAARDVPETNVTWSVFPRESGVLDLAAAPTVERTGTGAVVVVHPLARRRTEPPTRFLGLLVARSPAGVLAFQVDTTVAGVPAAADREEDAEKRGVVRFVAVALLGLIVGTILGRMVLRRREAAEAGPGKE